MKRQRKSHRRLHAVEKQRNLGEQGKKELQFLCHLIYLFEETIKRNPSLYCNSDHPPYSAHHCECAHVNVIMTQWFFLLQIWTLFFVFCFYFVEWKSLSPSLSIAHLVRCFLFLCTLLARALNLIEHLLPPSIHTKVNTHMFWQRKENQEILYKRRFSNPEVSKTVYMSVKLW